MEQYKQDQRSICRNCGDNIIFQSGSWIHPQFISCSGGCLKPESVTYKEATHNLSCSHSYRRGSRVDYNMPCIILKELPNNKVKIIVFGDRRKKQEYCNRKQQIRYVDKDRLTKLQEVRHSSQA